MKSPSYSEKMSFIRPLVAFDFKNPDRLGRKNKLRITRHYRAAKNILAKYAPIKKKYKTLPKLQKAVNQDPKAKSGLFRGKEWAVIFRPTRLPKDARPTTKGWKYGFNKGKGRKGKKGIVTQDFVFDRSFWKNPQAWIEKLPQGSRYWILTNRQVEGGEWDVDYTVDVLTYNVAGDIKQLMAIIDEMLNRYDSAEGFMYGVRVEGRF